MELLDRYVHEVGRRLPAKLRGDVEQELRSLFADAMEERTALEPGMRPDEVEKAVLRDMGDPETVAARYNAEPNYLIGPALFPAFLFTLRLMAIILAALFAVPIFTTVVVDPHRVTEYFNVYSFGSMGREFVRAYFIQFALVVVVFAVLERAAKHFKPAPKATSWDPAKLPAVNDPDRVSTPGMVTGIYFTFALLIVLTFFPHWFGPIGFQDGRVRAIPYYELGLNIPEVALQLWWAASIVLQVVVLRQGRWRRETRWVEFVLGVAASVILYVTLAGSTVPDQLPNIQSHKLGELLSRMVYTGLGIAFLVSVIVNGVRLYQFIARYSYERRASATVY